MKVLRNAKFTGNIKINDTNTNIYFQAYDDGILQKLDAGQCSFRIKNDTGYLITISNVSIENDYIVFKSNELKSLPVGTYYLELWVENSAGTCIYPDENFCKLRINENVTVAQGSTIPTISLEEYENKLQGYVDNAISDGTQKIESDFDKYVDSITDSTIANANNAIKATKASPVNYVPNSDFKTDLNDFYLITSSDGTVQVIEQGFGFENSLRISISNQTQNKYFGIKLKDWMSVQPNMVISLGTMFKGSDLDAKAKMEINVYNSDKVKVGSTGVYGDNNSTFEKGVLKLENYTIPADGSLLEIKFFVIKNGTIEIAHPMLVQGASLPNAWYDDDLSELKIANTAKSTADSASQIANNAQAAAGDANAIANAAKSTADTALSKANVNAGAIASNTGSIKTNSESINDGLYLDRAKSYTQINSSKNLVVNSEMQSKESNNDPYADWKGVWGWHYTNTGNNIGRKNWYGYNALQLSSLKTTNSAISTGLCAGDITKATTYSVRFHYRKSGEFAIEQKITVYLEYAYQSDFLSSQKILIGEVTSSSNFEDFITKEDITIPQHYDWIRLRIESNLESDGAYIWFAQPMINYGSTIQEYVTSNASGQRIAEIESDIADLKSQIQTLKNQLSVNN